VTIDNDASQSATIIEASGRDRSGLLEALARVLTEADLSIQSAHIDGHGERAVDSFYVVDQTGGKLTSAGRTAQVRARLSEILDTEPHAKPSHLSRARANPAR
jgi:[protein-PII] uridylyltransferase